MDLDAVPAVSHSQVDLNGEAMDSTPVPREPISPALDEQQFGLEGPSCSPLHVAPSAPQFAKAGRQIFLDICSGATRPLSQAILDMGGDVLSFDILLDEKMDLLNDCSFEQLLRICSSGSVR